MVLRSIFAKALLLCCASLISQCPVSAQDGLPLKPEEINDDYELIARTHLEAKTKLTANVGGGSISPDRSPLTAPVPPPSVVEVSSKWGSRKSVLERAYLDAFNILSGSNKCSDLLGGRRSITALNDLVNRLGMKSLSPSIAMQMSGPTTTYQSHLTGFTYRLFEKAELNLNGLFFRDNFINQPRVPSIGGFPPNSREARVTVLLHELGHLVKGRDKRWLLPDDGDNERLSVNNTTLILDACRDSINAVSNGR